MPWPYNTNPYMPQPNQYQPQPYGLQQAPQMQVVRVNGRPGSARPAATAV